MTVQLQIPQPPDELFKLPRTGHLLNETQPIYLIEKIEAVEHKGILITYKNVPYVRKTFPTPEATYALNQVKRLLRELVTFPFIVLGVAFSNKTKLCKSFNVIFTKIAGPHVMKEEFMCRASFNVANFVHSVLISFGVDSDTAKETAFNLAQIIEYDDAYRYRMQDLLTELDIDLFTKSPSREVKRLWDIFEARSTDGVPRKLQGFLYVFMAIAFLKKKTFIENVNFLKQATYDEDDRYWMCLRDDKYNYFGLTPLERHELYTERPISYMATA